MLNREMQTVQVLTYVTNTDAYGQLHTDTPTSRNIQAVVKTASQVHVDDPRYNDIDVLMLTKDSNITDSNVMQVGSNKYQILHIIPAYSNRGTSQLYLKLLK